MPRKSRRSCEICGVREAHLQKPLFFGNFPLNEDRCKEWVRVTGNEDLVHLPIEKLHSIKHVCGNHFDEKDFIKNGKRLKKHAVPSINFIAPPLTTEQMSGFPCHTFVHSEVTPSTSKECQGPATDQGHQNLKNNESEVVKSKLLSHTVVHSEVTVSEECPGPIPEDQHQNIEEKTQVEKRKRSTDEELTTRKNKPVKKLIKTKRTLKSLKNSTINLEKIQSPILKDLIINTCKNESRKPNARRWTMQHKLHCLDILKSSPETYRYLSSAVPLPTIKTLLNIQKKVPMSPGTETSP